MPEDDTTPACDPPSSNSARIDYPRLLESGSILRDDVQSLKDDGYNRDLDDSCFFLCTLSGTAAIKLNYNLRPRRGHGKRAADLIVVEVLGLPSTFDQVVEFSCRISIDPAADASITTRLSRNQPVVALAVPIGRTLDDTVSIIVETTAVAADTPNVPRAARFRIFLINQQEVFDALEERIVWAFGVARSGTTWISEIIARLGRILPIDESGLGRMHGVFCWDPERFYGGWEGFFSDHPTETEVQVDGRIVVDRELRPFQRQATWFSSAIQGIYHEKNSDLFRRMFCDTTFNLIIREWGLTSYDQILIKSPNDSQFSDFIQAWMPNAKLIGVFRDGRDVMRSRFSRFASNNLAEARDLELRRYAVAWYSHMWNLSVDVSRHALDRHNVDKVCTIRYEDIRLKTSSEILRVSEFLGVPLSLSKADEISHQLRLENQPLESRGDDKPMQSGTVCGFRDYFSSDEIALMNQIMGRNLRKLGYHVDEQ